ncbi:MAG: MBL fold metallo-hydrolase [Clostridia bacterium]|nr:MBL fold metallo-hydrolase [Clostridia bacterium]
MKKFLLFIFSLIFAFGFTATLNFGVVRADETEGAGVIEYGSLTVHFIDVGQGDACIVELPDGRTMIIDAGENNKSTEAKLDQYIAANVADSDGEDSEFYFDFAILTHSDADHIGSMDYVLQNYPARTVYRPNEECKNDTYCSGDPANDGDEANECFWGDSHGSKTTVAYHWALYRAYESAEKVIVTNPYDDTQNVITSSSDKDHEEYQINFYAPLSSEYNDHNNYSPIIVIDYQGRSIVLSGDAEAQCEAEFVEAARGGEGRYARFSDFSADVIKLGHHGSRTSSSEDYLNVMTKSELRSEVFVIISCGEGNSYGHPHPEVLSRLADMGFSSDYILRTDLLGDIVLSIGEVDGEYQVTYGDKTGGTGNGNQVEGGNGDTPQGDVFDKIADELNRLLGGKPFTVTRRHVIVALVVIAVIVIVVVLLSKKKSKKSKRNNKRK